MKKILLAILAALFTQTFADTPEEWIARANSVIKKEIRASSNTIRSAYSLGSLGKLQSASQVLRKNPRPVKDEKGQVRT